MAFRLRITEGKGEGKVFTFAQPSVKIGRLPDNDLVLYDMGVSRFHCEILQDSGSYTLRDTGSANGTSLNDQVTTEAQLSSGDRIQVGPVAFLFEPREGKREAEVEEEGSGALFRPDTEQARRTIEEQATSAFSREEFERNRQREPTAKQPKTRPPAAADEADERVERRTDTGSFVSPPRKKGWAALPRSTRLAILLALTVVLAGGAVSAWIIKQQPRKDRSAEIFTADRANAALKFGAGKVDVFTPDRVNFQFDFHGGRVTLHYAAGGIESPAEVEVLLNGKRVTDLPPSPGRWTTGLKMSLPRHLLQPGTNVLTFDNTLTPAKPERWGVARVEVVEEKLPPPDENKARELYKLGEVAYDTRSVAPHNLARSIQYYEDGLRYLEAMDPPPALYAEIEKAKKRAADELQSTYESYIFAAEKALRFGDRREAAESLRELLRFFPDAGDPRHEKAKKRLTDLVGRGAP